MHGTYDQIELRDQISIEEPSAVRSGWKERFVSSFFDRLEQGVLTVQFPSGAQRTFVGRENGLNFDDHAILCIHDWKMVGKAVRDGAIGFAESYAADHWSSPDLSRLLSILGRNEPALHHFHNNYREALGQPPLEKVG